MGKTLALKQHQEDQEDLSIGCPKKLCFLSSFSPFKSRGGQNTGPIRFGAGGLDEASLFAHQRCFLGLGSPRFKDIHHVLWMFPDIKPFHWLV